MNKLHSFLLSAALAGVAATAGAAPLEIDYKQSKLDVVVSATIDSFVGHLDKYQTTVECDGSTNLPAKAAVSFNFSDLKTGNTDRDAEMLKWLEYPNTPTASFALTGWKTIGTTNIAVGQITIHGVKKAIEMPVTVKNSAGSLDIIGEAALDYRDFNLPKIRKMLMLVVDPHLKVKFHIVGKLPAAK
jgi:polyisoprenoid-binding protein YceI